MNAFGPFSPDFQPARRQVVEDSTPGSPCNPRDMVLRVRGACMDPVLADGMSVRVRRKRCYLPGDVVAYYCPYQKQCLIHRFLGYVPGSGRWKCLTMPDHGLKPDVLVEPANILGKLVDKKASMGRRKPAQRLRSFGRYLYWVARLAVQGRR